MKKNSSNGNTPFSKRIGRLQVSIFENENKEGKIYFSTYIRRPYQTEDGQWKDGPLSKRDLEQDLPDAQRIATEHIAKREKQLRKSNLLADS